MSDHKSSRREPLETFEMVYFGLVLTIELVSTLICAYYYRLVGQMNNIDANKALKTDIHFGFVLVLLRILWSIGGSCYVIYLRVDE